MSQQSADLILQAVAASLKQEAKSFLASDLANHLQSIETDNRFQYDPVARNIAATITKVAKTNPNQIITAQQINEYHDEISSLNPESTFKNTYPQIFPESSIEVPVEPEVPTSVNNARHNYVDSNHVPGDASLIVEEGRDDPQFDFEKPEFQIGAKLKPEFHRFAEQALKFELAQFGATNIRVANKNNTPSMMIYAASFVTPTGKHEVVVPVRVAQDQVLLPEIFGRKDQSYTFSKTGFEQFEKDNLQILNVKSFAAADKLRISAGDDTSRQPSSLDQFINKEVAEDDELKLFDGDDKVKIEAVLHSAILAAKSKHSHRVIASALETVSRRFATLGCSPSLRFIGDGEKNDILVSATITDNQRQAEVTIPLETRGEKVLFPDVFVIADKAYPLTQNGLKVAFASSENTTDYLVADLEAANYNTLRQTVYTAAVKKDSRTAEAALKVVAKKYGRDAWTNIVDDYQKWLTAGTTSPAAAGTKMSSDDWVNAVRKELKTLTGSADGNTKSGEFKFEQFDEPGFQGMISANRIDHIEFN